MGLGERIKDTGVISTEVECHFIQLFAVNSDLLYDDRRIPGRYNGLKRHSTNETYYPHKYAVQITTDSPQWGRLSGCTFEEAVSWGKESPNGRLVQCYCDATTALPIVSHALAERIKFKRKGMDFSLINEQGHARPFQDRAIQRRS